MDDQIDFPVKLPRYKRNKKRVIGENAWSENYGATVQAARYAGIKIKSPTAFQGFWQHGSFGPWDTEIPDSLTYFKTDQFRSCPVFVARKDEAKILHKQGLPQTRAIGLPILYAKPIDQPRLPESLLIVPTHAMAGMKAPDRTAFVRYADQVKTFFKEYKSVAVCIHPSCWENGVWIDEFKKLGVPIIKGADGTDQNALCRIRTLFRSFESVTTNGWGSHVAYALADNARISIFGTQPTFSADEMRKVDETTRTNFSAQSYRLSPEFAAKRDKHLEKYFVSPTEGIQDVEYGQYLIGSENQIDKSAMKDLILKCYQSTFRQRFKARGQALERSIKALIRKQHKDAT